MQIFAAEKDIGGGGDLFQMEICVVENKGNSVIIKQLYCFSKVNDYQVITLSDLRAVQDHSVNTAT